MGGNSRPWPARTRSFRMFGGWKESKGDPSENKTLLQSYTVKQRLAITNHCLLGLSDSVGLGW